MKYLTSKLQQCLPFMVLKRTKPFDARLAKGCNSAYRLRY